MAATAEKINAEVPCPCGRWKWREADAVMGLTATERFCPRCRRRHFIVWRDHRVVAVVEFPGRDVGSFVQALESAGLRRDEVEGLTRIMRLRVEEA